MNHDTGVDLATTRSWARTASPTHARVAGRLSFLVLVSVALGLVLLPWQQTSFGAGRVVAYSPTERQQSVDAPIEGRLGRWFVHEGSIVKAGDPIVEIVDNDPDILKRIETERRAVVSRLQAARISIDTARQNLNRQSTLFENGLSSKRSLELARQELAKFVMDEASAEAEIARIDVRLARQGNQLVTAPRDGTVLRRTAGEGSVLVKAGDPLAVLVPETSSRAVELWIDGNDLPLIFASQEVRLQFEGWPAVQFSGWPQVSVGTFAGEIRVVDAADDGTGRFRVLVVPREGESWPDGRYLRQGVRAHGWALLGQVRLGYELWRRFNGFPPSLADAQVPKTGEAKKETSK